MSVAPRTARHNRVRAASFIWHPPWMLGGLGKKVGEWTNEVDLRSRGSDGARRKQNRDQASLRLPPEVSPSKTSLEIYTHLGGGSRGGFSTCGGTVRQESAGESPAFTQSRSSSHNLYVNESGQECSLYTCCRPGCSGKGSDAAGAFGHLDGVHLDRLGFLFLEGRLAGVEVEGRFQLGHEGS